MMNTKSLEFYKKLVNSGAKESLAQSIVEVIEESSHLGLDGLSTKEDLRELRSELKGDINELRSELKGDIRKLELDMDSKFERLINKIDSKFQVIYIVGGIVSTILLKPTLSEWFKPIIQQLTGH